MSDALITIIGGGIVGTALAYELSKTLEGVVLLEGNKNVRSDNQTSRNSGVIHAGIYYDKHDCPIRAELCVRGNALMYQFCDDYNAKHENNRIPHKKTGKLVVAVNDQEMEYLEHVKRIADENDVPGVEWLTGEQAQKMESNVRCIGALYVPTSGVIEPVFLTMALQRLAEEQGVDFMYGSTVIGIESSKTGFRVTTQTNGHQQPETFETTHLINAAGLYSDDVAQMVNPENTYVIRPARGEAAAFRKHKRSDLWMSGMNVYPAPYGYYNKGEKAGEKADVPYEEFKRLQEAEVVTETVGVHLTPTLGNDTGEYYDDAGQVIVSNTVTIGPAKNMVGKNNFADNLRPTEYYHSRVKGFFPSLELDDISLFRAGIEARAAGYKDWVIERDRTYPNCVQLIGIGSPGMTSSLAIAEHVKKNYFP